MTILSNLFAAHTVFYILSFIHLYTGLSTALKGGCLWGPGIASLEEYICVDMLKWGNRNSTSSVSQLAGLFHFVHNPAQLGFQLPRQKLKRLGQKPKSFQFCAGRGNRNPVF